jgi:hypothetical protein
MDRGIPIRDHRDQSRPNPFGMCRYKTPLYLHIPQDFKSFRMCRYAAVRANSFRMCRYVNRGRGRYSSVEAKRVALLFPLPVPLSSLPPCAPGLRALRVKSYPLPISSPACFLRRASRRLIQHSAFIGRLCIFNNLHTQFCTTSLFSSDYALPGEGGGPPIGTDRAHPRQIGPRSTLGHDSRCFHPAASGNRVE